MKTKKHATAAADLEPVHSLNPEPATVGFVCGSAAGLSCLGFRVIIYIESGGLFKTSLKLGRRGL